MQPRTVVACAADTNRRAAVWSSAVGLAATRKARLILYDIDATSFWTSPFPEFESGRYQHPLSPAELREMGRVNLASQVENARARGVDAYGWLPMTPGVDSMFSVCGWVLQPVTTPVGPCALEELRCRAKL